MFRIETEVSTLPISIPGSKMKTLVDGLGLVFNGEYDLQHIDRDDRCSNQKVAAMLRPKGPRKRTTHLTITTSGFPFSTTYVASSTPGPLPTFFAAWIVPAGMNKTSPALSVAGGLPST